MHLFLHCVPKQAILSCICEWAQAVAHRQDVGKAGWQEAGLGPAEETRVDLSRLGWKT